MVLSQLLRSLNTDDRILAYHALLAIRSRAIISYNMGRKFIVDVVPADSPPLIYILEAESPRIALIGRPVDLPVGATFVSRDKLFTVRVDDAEEIRVNTAVKVDPQILKALEGLVPDSKEKDKHTTVTVYYRSPLSDKDVLLRTTQDLTSFIARATWVPDPTQTNPTPYIGATYQRITEVLAEMAAEKTIDATVVVQHAPDLIMNPTDLALSGRPEGSTISAQPGIPDKATPPVPQGAPAGKTP